MIQLLATLRLPLVLLLLASHPVHADPSTQPLSQASPEAADAKTKYEAAVNKLQAEFAERAGVEQARYMKRLEVIMADQTKRGNLEAALAVRQELAGQKSGSFQQAKLSGT